jgi:hypothetical protein
MAGGSASPDAQSGAFGSAVKGTLWFWLIIG